MAGTGASHAPEAGTPADQPRAFASLLAEDVAGLPSGGDQPDPALVSDIYLDQIVAAVADGWAERELISQLLYQRAGKTSTVAYRQEVFRDLEDPGLFRAARQFAGRMDQVHAHLGQLAGLRSGHQREGWFLDAGAIYCDAVRTLAADLAARPAASRGLLAFREYLAAYADSAGFARLAADTADRQHDLAQVTYQVRIKGARVEVSRYDGEPDYSAEIAKTFERFQQGAVKDYRVQYRTWPGMNHVGAALPVGLLLLAVRSGSLGLASFAHVPPGVARATAQVLLIVGFTVKVGLVPFQIWLPRGYAAAPGPPPGRPGR